ncbi:MAG: glycosyltransferase family A protein [Patescibacteria group bacterium]
MKLPTLSIVIPCYNEEELVGKCLWNILKQDVLPEEVIFIDNNSIDKSVEIAKTFIDKFKNRGVDFKILVERQQGILATRKLGFSKVSCELIGTIDSDTVISRNWVKIAKNMFLKNKNLACITGPLTFYNLNFLIRNFSKIIFVLYKIKFFFIMWGCNGVFSKKNYNKLDGLKKYDDCSTNLGLKYTYDDNYLSERFKLIGQTKCVWKLKATGESRPDKSRGKDQIKQFWRIKRYIRKKYKNEK